MNGRPSRGSTDQHSTLPPVTSFQSEDKVRRTSAAPARGGGLRIGKVITDARAAVHPNNQPESARSVQIGLTTSTRLLDGEERRVQDEIIEMLTTRLAKKEKESELLRRQQDAFDAQRDQLESQAAQLEQELMDSKAHFTTQMETLQLAAQQAQLQADRFRLEAESHRVSLSELRRQRERDGEFARTKEQQHERQLEDLRRELTIVKIEKESLEQLICNQQEQLGGFQERNHDTEARRAELEGLLTESRQTVSDLTQQLEASCAALSCRDGQLQQANKEKQSLEEKVQQISRSLRELTMRAADVERRKSDLSQTETQLTKQLTQLHRDNEDLKARNGQLQTQAKQLQTRITSLESGKVACEAKLRDISEEVEHARKRVREYHFRVQQLQEEVKFLSKKKPGTHQSAPLESTITATPATTPSVATVPAANDHKEPADASAMPSWMRD